VWSKIQNVKIQNIKHKRNLLLHKLLKMEISVRSKHRPIHLYASEHYYFLTLRAINHIHYFNSVEKKKVIVKVIKKSAEKFQIKIFAWVVLDNHIHLLFLSPEKLNLPDFITNMTSNISRGVNVLDGKVGRRVFNNYWDYCIRDERDFFSHLNYIHHNPVKHKYVKTQEDCRDYEFCSYGDWLLKKGEEWMADCFEKFPIVDFTVDGDE